MTNRLVRIPRSLAILSVAFFILASPRIVHADETVPPSFVAADHDTLVSETGYITLVWRGHHLETKFEVQGATTNVFHDAETLYQGSNTSLFLSGLPNGTYFYRVRTLAQSVPISAWSEPLRLTVRHHSAPRALMLFALGGVIFAVTTAVIIRGHAACLPEHRQATSGTRP